MHSRRISLALAVAATSTSLVMSTSAIAAPAHHRPDRTPTAKARAAGVTAHNGAYAGWSKHGTATSGPTPYAAATQTLGIDVSAYQGNVDWASYWGQGVRWTYVKATEGTYYTNQDFAQQYNGSYNQGMIRGAYHFANPSTTGGATQADYFVDHGGGWSKDGRTLPGMLDVEPNPYGSECYGLTQSQLVGWIKAFNTEYHARTGRDVVIYTSRSFWSTCTGNSTAFNQTNPLDIARWSSTPGTLPGGWSYYTFWQFTDTPVDKNWFNGDQTRLKALANG